ncbi:AAEL001096-PA [Aedes aegypti]|uniref:AAEL001096-PA n=1 Tax=Aedes aegypti TaxID=7159 RepID=Q17M89_AEDAE|nr:AAEL001096-PA [Aedes aegypti]
MYYSKLFLLVALSSFGGVFGGLFDILSTTTDYNLAFAMDTLFGLVINTTEFWINGNNTDPIEVNVKLMCGNRNTATLSRTFINDGNLKAKIDTSKPMVFITHGWVDNGNRVWIKELKDDYLKYFDTNVCVVDWGNLAIVGYMIAVKNTFDVGQYVAQFITYLSNQGIPLSKVTLVGHSLGAQISGHIGHNLGGQVGAIYGLDPAGPLFTMPFDVGTSKRLDKSDAKYVQTIVTSKCTTGVCAGDGHENFYPNGGWVPQVNCGIPLLSNAESPELISCSHSHSITLFRMALNPKNVFTGKACVDYFSYYALMCLFSSTTKMGVYSSRIGGNFHVKTSAFTPFT